LKKVDLGGSGFQGLVDKVGEGVLFIDEAPAIIDGPPQKVKSVVTALLTAAENKRDTMSFFLAGLVI